MFTVTIVGNGVMRFEKAAEALGSQSRAYTAFRRALNDTSRRAFTQVKRAVSKQMGTTQQAVVNHGKLRRIPAAGTKLETSINSSGGYLPTALFAARQTKSGVSAAPWATRRIFPHTFIVKKLGGNVFHRTGKGRLPIQKHFGPAVPKELVRDQSKAAFETIASTFFPAEVMRQVRVLTSGVLS